MLWLPSAWQNDAELWGLLMSRIGDAIGHPPEMLSEDPSEAHLQYNNRGGDGDSLAVPLVATDPRLDSIGIGLLDCPDIVSDEAFGLGSPQARRELLGRAATLCSAFMVVSSAESSRDATLGDLLRIASDLMPGVPRLSGSQQDSCPSDPGSSTGDLWPGREDTRDRIHLCGLRLRGPVESTVHPGIR